jgi:hypothetical protein
MVVDTQQNNPAVDDKPLNIVEEARFLRDEIKKEKEALKAERELLQKTQAESLLSSSAGAQIPIVAPPVETAKDYANKVMKGEIKAQ